VLSGQAPLKSGHPKVELPRGFHGIAFAAHAVVKKRFVFGLLPAFAAVPRVRRVGEIGLGEMSTLGAPAGDKEEQDRDSHFLAPG